MGDIMKAIFTNISGVLSDTNSFRDYIEYYYLYNNYNIDDSIKAYDQKKFDLLSEICKENNASVVLSSSWRYYYTIDERFDNELIRILKEFKNHEIPFYGFTPELKNEKVKDVSDLINMNSINEDEDANIFFDFVKNNKNLENKKEILDQEVMNMRNYHEEKYSI